MKIQDSICAVMAAKKLKLTDVTERTGLSYVSITNIRNGKMNISLSSFERISKALEVNPSDLMRLMELEEEGKTYQELLFICTESILKNKSIYGNY